MDEIEKLRRGLAAASSTPPAQWHEPTLKLLRERTAHLQTWIKASGAGAPPPANAVADAIRAFLAHQEFTKLRDARYVCFGCTDPIAIGKDRYRLIEDERRFPRLLDCVEQYRKTPRPFRRCYHGLFHGYLAYDPEGDDSRLAGKKNWTLLRTYLNERTGAIRVPGAAEPDWVDAITRNSELLTDRACDKFGREALEGNSNGFETACKDLEIADKTWVVRKFVLAQLTAATAKNDRSFRQLLPQVRDMLESHPLFLDDGLGPLLERYRKCTPADLDVGLRDFAVKHWGNPWLKNNDKKWKVSDEARQMVTGWLKLKFMEKFFGLLAEDGVNDPRRLNFWLRYIDHISDMYFALGNNAMHNNSPDFKQLRNEMTGRVLQLYASGSPTNNAFIMRIGSHVVVEFGASGNACFVFDGRLELPFKLTGYVAGDSTALKHKAHSARLLHVNRADADWEYHFERELSRLLRVTPEPAARAQRRTARSQPAHSSATAPSPPFAQAAFDQLVRTNNLTIADKRGIGGALWVFLGKAESPVTRQLRALGFAYNEHKTAWWRG